jgi:hypothetical protein
MTLTWADDIICTHFLKNEGVDGKIFEEKFILTIWTRFLQICFKICCHVFSRRHGLEQTTPQNPRWQQHLHTFTPKLMCGWENTWIKVICQVLMKIQILWTEYTRFLILVTLSIQLTGISVAFLTKAKLASLSYAKNSRSSVLYIRESRWRMDWKIKIYQQEYLESPASENAKIQMAVLLL